MTPSTARDRAIEQWRISPVTSLVVGWLLPAVGELMRQLHAADLDAQEAGVPTEQADVPVGGSAPATEPEPEDGNAFFQTAWAEHGRCTCLPGDDIYCEEERCALCTALPTAWPCPTTEHRGYPGTSETTPAGGSAPHQGATTDVTEERQHPEGDAACTACAGHGVVTDPGYYVPGEQFVEPPTEDQCGACAGTGASDVQRLVSQRTAVLARLAAIESNDMFRRILSGFLPSTIFTAEVRALLGAGETTEETHG